MEQDILVITATLGNRETLARTIQTVREIGGNRVKHVIVAPASIIPKIKERYQDIECLAEPKGRKGIYAALNHGFRTYGKNYKYLAFINDDDYWLPNYKLLIDTIYKDNSLSLVYGKTCYIDKYNTIIGNQTCSNQFKQFIPLICKGIVLLTQQATLMTSELYFKIGGFDESYVLVADTKFWAKASLLNIKTKYINKVCAAYMIQTGQLSSDKQTQKNEHLKLIQTYNHSSSLIQRTAKFFFRLNNINIYINRFIKKSNCKNPFSN